MNTTTHPVSGIRTTPTVFRNHRPFAHAALLAAATLGFAASSAPDAAATVYDWSSSVPSTDITLNNGDLIYYAPTGGTVESPVTSDVSGAIRYQGAGAVIYVGENAILNRYSVVPDNRTFGNAAFGSRIVKEGPGTLRMTGNSDNSSDLLIVNAGTVLLNKTFTNGQNGSGNNNNHVVGGGNFIEPAITINGGLVKNTTGTTISRNSDFATSYRAWRDYGNNLYYTGTLEINNGTFDLGGYGEIITALKNKFGQKNGVVTNSDLDNLACLVVGATNNTSSTFEGTISGNVIIIKQGNTGTRRGGMFTLTGDNTYTGGTQIEGGYFINQGKLLGTGGVSIQSGNSAMFINSGTVNSIVQTKGVFLSQSTETKTASIAGYRADANNTLRLEGPNIALGAICLDAGVTSLQFYNSGSRATADSIHFGSGSLEIDLKGIAGDVLANSIVPILATNAEATGTVPGSILVLNAENYRSAPSASVVTTAGKARITVVGGSEGPDNLTWKAGSTTWDTKDTVSWDGTTDGKFYWGDKVTFNAAATVTVANTVAPGSIVVNIDTNNPVALSGGNITGGTSVIKRGTGVLTMSGNNSFTGGIYIEQGQVTVTSGAIPNLIGTKIVVGKDDGSTTATLMGSGQHVWGGVDNYFYPEITINKGSTVRFNEGTAIGDVILKGGTLIAGGYNVGTNYGGIHTLALNGTITVLGDGSGNVLTSTFSNTGNWREGIVADGKSATGTTFDIREGAFLDVTAELRNGNGTRTGIVKEGAGTLRLNKVDTDSARQDRQGIVINGGTVIVNASNTAGHSVFGKQEAGDDIYVNNNSTLHLNLNNVFGNHDALTPVVIYLSDTSTLTASTGTHNSFGTVVLRGGTILAQGTEASWGAFGFNGKIIAEGEGITSCLISAVDPETGASVNGDAFLANGGRVATTFDVHYGSTLEVSLILRNGRNSGGSYPEAATSLIKEGEGRMILTATNTYSNNTTVSAGTLQLGNATAHPEQTGGSIATNLSLAAGTSLIFDKGNSTSSHAKDISGDGCVIKYGSGSVTLGGANTYTGTTTIEGGTLVLAGTNVGSSYVLSNAGSTLKIADGGSVGTSASITIPEGTTFHIERNNADLSLTSTTITGAGDIRKSGTRAATLGNANGASGAFIVEGGTLSFTSSPSSVHHIEVSTSGTLDIGVGTFVLNNPNTSFVGHTTGSHNDITGSLSIGANSVGGHTLRVGKNTGTFETLAISQNLSFSDPKTTLRLDIGNGINYDKISLGNSLNIASGAVPALDFINANTDDSPLSQGVRTIITTTGGLLSPLILTATLTGVPQTAENHSELYLTPDNKTLYLGIVNTAEAFLWRGTSADSAWDNLYSHTPWQDGTGTAGFYLPGAKVQFDANGYSDVSIMASVTPYGILVTAGSHTLTNTGAGKISDYIWKSTTTPTALTISGGTITFSSTGRAQTNDFTGPVALSGSGTLNLSGTASIATASGISLGGSATFNINNTANGTSVKALNGTSQSATVALGNRSLEVGEGSYAGKFTSITGTLTKTGAGVLTLSGTNNAHFGGIVVKEGTLAIFSDANLGNTYNATYAPLATLTLGDAVSNTPGTLLFADAAAITRPVFIAGIAGGTVNTNGFTASISPLSGSGPFTKSGAGTLTLDSPAVTSAPAFTGAITVADGTLEVRSLLGTAGTHTSALTLTPSATLIFNQTAAQTLSGTLSGTPAQTDRSDAPVFTKEGNGHLTLTGDASAYAGNFAVNSGILEITSTLGTLAIFPGDLALGGGTLHLNQAANQTLTGALTGFSTFAKSGAGELLLSANALATGYNGNIELRTGSGALRIQRRLGLDGNYPGNISLASGTELHLNQTADQTLSGSVTGTGTLVKDASATPSVLTFTGSTPSAANLSILSGTLHTGTGNALTGTVSLGAGVTLAGTGTVTSPVFTAAVGSTPGTNIAPGSLTPANAIGTLTLGTSAGTVAFDGTTLTLDLRGDSTSDLIAVAGNATFGLTSKNAFIVHADPTEGWSEGSYTILTAAGTLNANSANLDNVKLYNRGVEVVPVDRINGEVVQAGNDLQLKIHLAPNFDLYWNDTTPTGTGVWQAGQSLVNWLDGEAPPAGQVFQRGDLVNFTDAGALAKNVNVSNLGGGVAVGQLTVAGGTYTFGTYNDPSPENSQSGTTANIVGLTTAIGSLVTATDKLIVAATANATFNAGVNFGNIEVTGEATFAAAVTAGNALTIAPGAKATFTDGAQLLAPGTQQTSIAALTNSGTLVLHATATYTGAQTELAAPLTGTGALQKTGDGRFLLTGDNAAYTGAISVADGTLALGSTISSAASAGVTLDPDATLELAYTTPGTLLPALTGAGNLHVTGAQVTLNTTKAHTGSTVVDGGTLALALTHTLTASTTIHLRNSGTLALDAQDALLPTSTLTIATGGTLTTTQDQTLAAVQIAATAGPLDFGGASLALGPLGNAASAIAAPLSHLAVLTLGGAGAAPELTLAGTDVLATVGTITIADSAALHATAPQTFAHLTLAPAATLDAAAQPIPLHSGALHGTLTGSGAQLIKTTNGTLILATASQFTGQARHEGGTLTLNATDALAAASLFTVTGQATLNTTQDQHFTAVQIAADSGLLDFGGADVTVGASTPASSSTLAAPLTAVGTFTLGSTTGPATAPTLALDTTDVLADTTHIALASGTLAVNADQLFADYTTAPATTTTLAPATTLSVHTGVLDGTLAGSASADSTLRKIADGTLTLTADNSATPLNITIEHGTLVISDDTNLGTGQNILDGGTLAANGPSFAKSWHIAPGGGTLQLTADSAFTGDFSGPGKLSKTGNGALVLNAPSPLTGDFQLTNGSLRLDVPDALRSAASVTLAATSNGATATASQTFNTLNIGTGQAFEFDPAQPATNRNLTLDAGTITGELVNAHDLVKTGPGNLAFDGATAAHPLDIDGKLSVLDGTLTIPLDDRGATIHANTVAFAPNAVLNVTGFFPGGIGDGISSAPTAYTVLTVEEPIRPDAFPARYEVAGAPAQNFATFQVTRGAGDLSILVSVGLAWYDPHQDNALQYDRAHGNFDVETTFNLAAALADRTNFASPVWDGKSLTKLGTGTLTLSAANSYTGDTTVNAGTLHITGLLGSSSNIIGSIPEGNYTGTIHVAAGATLTFAQTRGYQTLHGPLTGTGPLTKSGAASLHITGPVEFTNINIATGSTATFSGPTTLNTLTLDGTAEFNGTTTQLDTLTVGDKGTVRFTTLTQIVRANITGTVDFLADATIATPLLITGAKTHVNLGTGITLTLGNGGTFEAAPHGTGWTVENQTGQFTAYGLAGNLRNAGNADVDGDIDGNVTNAPTATLLVYGGIGGRFENSGTANVQGIVRGNTYNHTGATLELDNATHRNEVRGTLYNSGHIEFKNLGQKFHVANLDNATPGQAGHYSLELDGRAPFQSDHIEIAQGGTVTGKHIFTIRPISGDPVAHPEDVTQATTFELIRPEATGTPILAPGAQITLAAPLNIGLSQFNVQTGTATISYTGASSSAQAILGSAATLANAWFTQIDSLSKRLGDLRLSAAKNEELKAKNTTTAPRPAATDDAFWLRAHGLRANASLPGLTRFRETTAGGEVGFDHAFPLTDTSLLYLGAFAGYQTAHRVHRDGYGAKGDTDTPALGFYGTWLSPTGFYADLVFQGQYASSDFKVRDNQGTDTADFDNFSFGLSLEAGWQFKLPHAFTLTPAATLAYTGTYGTDYTTGGGIQADQSDSHTLRWGVNLTLARAFQLAGGGVIQPYIRLGYDEQDTTGGALQLRQGATTVRWHPNTDGGHTSVGAGLVWQVNAAQQVHLDYEGSWGTRYDVPWSLNAGWRLRF